VSRINPRSVLLAALQEGPRTFADLDKALTRGCVFFNRSTKSGTLQGWGHEHLLDRHLCHLIRGGCVRRREDGLYELRVRPVRVPAGTLKPGSTITLSGAIRTAAEAADTFRVKIIDIKDFDPGTGCYIVGRGLARGKAG
jgi:hypothetical protein